MTSVRLALFVKSVRRPLSGSPEREQTMGERREAIAETMLRYGVAIPPPVWGKPDIKGPEPDSDPEIFATVIAGCGCSVRAYSFTGVRDATICSQHSGADLDSGIAILRGSGVSR